MFADEDGDIIGSMDGWISLISLDGWAAGRPAERGCRNGFSFTSVVDGGRVLCRESILHYVYLAAVRAIEDY